MSKKIYTVPENIYWNASNNKQIFEIGELAQLIGKPGEEPILFTEHDPENSVLYKVISKVITVPNGTVIFLLEGYTPEQPSGIINILYSERIYLCMVAQIRKFKPIVLEQSFDDEL